MTDRSFERSNDESRERLARLIATLTPGQLAIDLGEGWTVASVLAHTGFWDRWQAERWTEILAGNWTAQDDSVIAAEHLANEALDPYWAGMDSPELPNLALEAADRLDALIAGAPDATIDTIEGGVAAYLLHRHRHRGEHLDQIERALAPATGTDEPVDRYYLERNQASRERLRDVVGRLTRADLARPIDPSDQSSWTIGQALGHLAFWDRFVASRWRAAGAAGPGHRPIYVPDEVEDLISSGLEPLLSAFVDGSGAGLMGEALAAADAVDGLIANLSDETLLRAVLAERPRMLDRSAHRAAHLDAIERALSE